MNINEEIEKFLNDKIISNKLSIVKEVSSILSLNEAFVMDRLNHFFPVYVVKRDSLKLSIDMDMETLPIEDIRFIEYLLDNMEDDEKMYIGSLSDDKIAMLILKNNPRCYTISCDELTGDIGYYFEHNIYQGSKSSDLDFINNLLLFLGIKKHCDYFDMATSRVDFDHCEYVYSFLVNNLSIMIVSNLHRNNVYLFDNVNIAQTPNVMESSIEDYFRLFYKFFRELIPTLIVDYKKFIEYVGMENFIVFTENVVNDNEVAMEEVIQNMYKHMIERQSGVVVNTDIIFESVKRYKKKYDN